MSLFHTLKISGSGLSAQRLRMDTISNNLANVNTTQTENGGPYRRQQAVFAPMFEKSLFQYAQFQRNHPHALPLDSREHGGGVQVAAITEDPSEGRLVYEPNHPDANAEGYVEYPNVNVVAEMTDMISATRAYEANVTAVQAVKAMALKALEMGRA